jgi:NHL repeat
MKSFLHLMVAALVSLTAGCGRTDLMPGGSRVRNGDIPADDGGPSEDVGMERHADVLPDTPRDAGSDRAESRGGDTSPDRSMDGAIVDANRDLGLDETLDATSDWQADAQSDGDVSSGTALDSGTNETGMLRLVAGHVGGPGQQDGVGLAAGLNSPGAMVSDGAGNLFVVDSLSNTIRKIVMATGTVSTFAGTPGTDGSADGTGAAARFHVPAYLAYDGHGHLFLAENNSNTVRQIDIATAAVTTLAGTPGLSGSLDGTGSDARFNSPTGVASDGAGSVFVTDTRNQTIRQIVVATGQVTTLVGSVGSSGSDDGVGSAARFSGPQGIACDGKGILWVADGGNDTIRQIVIATRAVTTLAGSAGTVGTVDGIGADARLNFPTAVASDGAGTLYFSEHTGRAIRKLVVASGRVTTLASSYGEDGCVDGTGAIARFFPSSLVPDGAGSVYFSDPVCSTIRKLDIASSTISTWAGSWAVSGTADGTGELAAFKQPGGAVKDGAGNLYVADSGNHTIRKVVLATGAVSTVAGTPGTSGSVDGVGAAAQFNDPTGVALDGAGSLLIADFGNNTIRKIALATGVVTTLAGSANASGATDGVGSAARFYHPFDLAVDGAGNLLVSDYGSGSIRKVVIATGAVTTVTNSGTQWMGPKGVALDGVGHLFFAGAADGTIRRVDLATGAVTVLAGASGIHDSVDGAGTAAHFRQPVRLTLDEAGHLFIAEQDYQYAQFGASGTVRMLTLSTGEVTTVVGSSGHFGTVVPGPLPNLLSAPEGLAFASPKQLYIVESALNAVLVAQF